MGRKRQVRKQKTSLLIITNGEVTERQYLSKLKQLVRHSNYAITIETMPVEAKNLIRKLNISDLSAYDEIWIVVDEDGRDHTQFIEQCWKKTTRSQLWVPVVSRPCFEVWLVAHYFPVKRYQDQADAQAHYGNVVGQSTSQKSLPNTFPFQNIPQAILNCRLNGVAEEKMGEMPPSPGSGMVHLVRRLGLV